MMQNERSDFSKKLRDYILTKRKSRLNLLGKIKIIVLEKKIFLQIIDFSWRSHLQYLEQLRQVIGLRHMVKKILFQNLKKRHLLLFEGLLAKIKNDLIKFLLNLNIVVSNEEQNEKVKKKVEKKEEKKLVEMKNVLVVQEKNLNIVMAIFNY